MTVQHGTVSKLRAALCAAALIGSSAACRDSAPDPDYCPDCTLSGPAPARPMRGAANMASGVATAAATMSSAGQQADTATTSNAAPSGGASSAGNHATLPAMSSGVNQTGGTAALSGASGVAGLAESGAGGAHGTVLAGASGARSTAGRGANDAGVDAGPCGSTCSGATPVCDPMRHLCVPCSATDPGSCSGGRPACSRLQPSCVECTDSDHTACDATGLVCDPNAERCVVCTKEDESRCQSVGLVCDPVRPRCVQCLDDGMCGDPQHASCNRGTNSCDGCTDDRACARFANTPVCDTTSGVCVECTVATEAARCRGGSCLPSHTCGQRSGTEPACATCTRDSDCAAGLGCTAAPALEGSAQRYCFPLADASGSCVNAPRPFARVAASDGSSPLQVCLPAASCGAVRAALAKTECKGPQNTLDPTRCGADQHDSICNENGQCTYSCDNDRECPSTRLSTCRGRVCG